MVKIKIHFYRGQHFFSKLIQWRTFSEFSHVSIEINSFIYEAKEFRGVIKTKPRNTPPKSLVETLEYEVPHRDAKAALEYLESQLGRGYDYLGLFSFVGIPKKKKDNKRFWCSEYVEEATNIMGITLETNFPVSPGALFLLCK